MTFKTYEAAHKWAMVHGRENCRPCDKWVIIEEAHEYKVAIKFKASGELVGFAE